MDIFIYVYMKIGLFDSGVGGLSVLLELKKLAPALDVVYFGDIANAPYGNKKLETLESLTFKGFRILRNHGAEKLVSACNSVSASVIVPMQDLFGIQNAEIIEMVGPAVQDLRKKRTHKIVVVATPATVKSGMYQQALEHAGLDAEVIPAHHKLAAAIEFGESDKKIRKYVEEVVDTALTFNPDTIVYGCTHYPFAHDVFSAVVKEKASAAGLYNPAQAVAAEVMRKYGSEGNGKLEFLISKDSKNFRAYVEKFFGEYESTINIIKH